MRKIKVTPQEYAEKTKMPISTVTKRLRENRSLPGVSKIEKFGRFYLLTIQEENGNISTNN